ncbi:hypothetical protein [Anaerococcus rubeinfantis]|uniref:hypothetical protein n=1 Tax=Anaerococcus rubeinfantis TaxID=1720199 RepID=UPI000AECD65D|nr:hypothetical protein [Anaerococcus rubeinfantis]
MSSYAVPSGNNNWTGSSKITPISIDEGENRVREILETAKNEKLFELEEASLVKLVVVVDLFENLTISQKKELKGEKGEKGKDIIVEALESNLE